MFSSSNDLLISVGLGRILFSRSALRLYVRLRRLRVSTSNVFVVHALIHIEQHCCILMYLVESIAFFFRDLPSLAGRSASNIKLLPSDNTPVMINESIQRKQCARHSVSFWALTRWLWVVLVLVLVQCCAVCHISAHDDGLHWRENVCEADLSTEGLGVLSYVPGSNSAL